MDDFSEASHLHRDTSLILAGTTNNLELLLEHGGHCHQRSTSGRTALQMAAKNVCYEAVQLLLCKGARIVDDAYIVPMQHFDPQRADLVAGLLLHAPCVREGSTRRGSFSRAHAHRIVSDAPHRHCNSHIRRTYTHTLEKDETLFVGLRTLAQARDMVLCVP